MGLGNIKDPDPKKRTPVFERITPLEIEMKICCEYLHITHQEYKALRSEERAKLLLYEEMQRSRTNDEAKQMKNKNKSTKGPELNGKRK